MTLLKNISIKAILIGGVIDVGGTIVAGGIAGIAYLYMTHGFPMSRDAVHSAFQSPSWKVIAYIIGGFFSVLGGYSAARIAKRKELLHAGFASFLCILPNIFFLLIKGFNGLEKPLIYHIGVTLLSIDLSILGGCVWKMQKSSRCVLK